MKKLLGVLVGLAVASGLTATGPAQAVDSTAPKIAAASAAPADFSMKQRFAREIVRYGQSDRGVYRIAHVRELQYRLRWARVYSAGVTGTFGPVTLEAVKRYQRREGLRVTGVANHATWAHLLRDTIRHRAQIPSVCRRDGWHACYDRSMHQVVLLRNGHLRNTWLVRGGASSTPTRLGTHAVYYRNRDHYSQMFDAPMPYAQFFDGGEALHGSAMMTDPFSGHSHGCVNMYIEDARQLWNITHDKRLVVTVYGRWS